MSRSTITTLADQDQVFPLASLPPELVQHVLSFLSFETISKFKMVSRSFNNLCQSLLLKEYEQLKRVRKQCQVIAESKLRPYPQDFSDPNLKVYHMVNIVGRGLTFVHLVQKCENVDYYFVPGKVLDEARYLLLMGKGEIELHSDVRKKMDNFMDMCERARKHFHKSLVPLFSWHCGRLQFEGKCDPDE